MNYDYICRTHQPPYVVTEWRRVDNRDEPVACPVCDGPMRRILTAPQVVVKARDKAAK